MVLPAYRGRNEMRHSFKHKHLANLPCLKAWYSHWKVDCHTMGYTAWVLVNKYMGE